MPLNLSLSAGAIDEQEVQGHLTELIEYIVDRWNRGIDDGINFEEKDFHADKSLGREFDPADATYFIQDRGKNSSPKKVRLYSHTPPVIPVHLPMDNYMANHHSKNKRPKDRDSFEPPAPTRKKKKNRPMTEKEERALNSRWV